MSTFASIRGMPPKEGYRLWSRVYDTQPNPLLTLEERFLELLLPPVNGLDVVDLGCGTGRWLARLVSRNPASLVGVDFSTEMLEKAERKLGGSAKLLIGDCEKVPLSSACADLVVCSFLGSYIENFADFAAQVRRILRPGGSVFFTDLHPTTVAKCGWRRGFFVDGSHIDIATYARPIEEILQSFQRVGLQASALLEPHFGEPEFSVFDKAGKKDSFQASSTHPAIFVLQLCPSLENAPSQGGHTKEIELQSIHGARIALGAEETIPGDLTINQGRIAFVGRRNALAEGNRITEGIGIDLTGFLLLPGLVNAHDHLEFALFPRLGKGAYQNFVEWAHDIHFPGNSPVLEHRAVPKDTRLWWGGIRNLLSGVTTVCHHNPYVAEVFDKGFVVRVLRDFGWAHSVSMDCDFAQKNQETPPDQPFLIHLAEGIDEQSSAEIFKLFQEHALDDRTVIIHGLGLDERGRNLLRSVGAALVWCPTSNVFLFGRTLTRDALQEFPRVALGSDSPLTSEGDLLDEIRFASEIVSMGEQQLYACVTTSAADVLRLGDGQGTLRVGALADFVGVRDKGFSPAKTIAMLSWRDVELVVIGGHIHLASSEMYRRLPEALTKELQLLEIEGERRWVRAPVSRLCADASRHLPGELKLGGRRVRHVFPA
jgi:cytosine/adenosine deaminase-related metal-dependent hydrolase/ubiquinone/menaquinone biosynthesis C-methylase UbiE